MGDYIDGPLAILRVEWAKLSDVQKQFLKEAHDGHFIYGAENGEVWAEGACKTGNLFTLDVEERPLTGSSVYVLREEPS